MKNFSLDQMLEAVLKVSERTSDINFSVGKAPQVEVDSQLVEVKFPGLDKLLPVHTEQIALHLMGGDHDKIRTLIDTGSTDCSYAIPGNTRFRVNIFCQRGTYAIVMRVIPSGIPSIADLNLAEELYQIAGLKNGIVLVTGPTGSGKSTTLAAIINEINLTKAFHVITIEDPIEYLHSNKMATINQREVGTDTKTFGLGLRAALRQAPKVILIGEMRDVETIEIAMEAAETGHLVLSTLHTIDASKTIERILGVFPKDQEAFIRTRLASSFKYIVSQRLVPKLGGGRIAVLEILKSTMRTRDYVLKGEKDGRSLVDAMKDGRTDGMQEFDGEFERCIREGSIDREIGLLYSTNPANLSLVLSDLDEEAGNVPSIELAADDGMEFE